jgi:hypothetical protein
MIECQNLLLPQIVDLEKLRQPWRPTVLVIDHVVPIQNLNPDVLVMEPTEDWYRCDAADLLRPAKIRSIFVQ